MHAYMYFRQSSQLLFSFPEVHFRERLQHVFSRKANRIITARRAGEYRGNHGIYEYHEEAPFLSIDALMPVLSNHECVYGNSEILCK